MKHGFTLLETMAAVAIMGTVTMGGLSFIKDENDKNRALRFGEEVKSIVKAVDTRILIDGYDISPWNTTSWNTNQSFVDNLLRKELVSTGSTCNGGGWTPSSVEDLKVQPINCFLFSKVPYDLEVKGKITADTQNFIEKFEMQFDFPSREAFVDNFKAISIAFNRLESSSEGRSGTHVFEYVNKTSGTILSRAECVMAAENCSLKASLVREGGSEYIRADGKNSLIGTHLTFIEAKGHSPMKCIRWTKTPGAGNWVSKSDENCGIGIYQDDPLMVELATDSSTANAVMLDKECAMLDYNAGTKKVSKISGKTSPCGMFNDGTEAIQILESQYASNAYYENIFGSKIESDEITTNKMKAGNLEATNLTTDNFTAKIVNIDDLIVNNIDAKNIDTDNLTVNIKAEIEELVAEQATFNGEVSFNDQVTFYEDAEFKKNIEVDGSVLANNIVANTGTIADLFSTNITVSNKIKTDKLEANIVDTNLLYANNATISGTLNATIPKYDQAIKDLEKLINDTNNGGIQPPTNQGWKTVYSGNGTRSILISDRTWSNYRVHVKYKGEGRAWVNEDKNLTASKVGLVSQNNTVSYTFKGQACNSFSVTATQSIYADSSRVSVPSADKTAKTVVGGNYGGCPAMTAYATLKDLYITKLELYY